MLHKFANTLLLFLCPGTSEFTDGYNQQINRIIYCNHCDTFLDPPEKLRDRLVEIQKTQPFETSKEALIFCVNYVFGKRNIY